jgi:hypothetical protein
MSNAIAFIESVDQRLLSYISQLENDAQVQAQNRRFPDIDDTFVHLRSLSSLGPGMPLFGQPASAMRMLARP